MLRRLPIARQIILLVTVAVLTSAAAMVAITLIGPPPRPAPTELNEVAAMLRGRPVENAADRPLQVRLSADMPQPRAGETRDAGLERWLADQLVSDPAELRAFTAVSPGAPPARPGTRKLFGEGTFAWHRGGQWRLVTVDAGSATLHWWLAVAGVTALVLGLIIAAAWTWARTITRPLERLADSVAAGETPNPIAGPPEVTILADALVAFQRSQADRIAERTRMLSAIAHDMGTPLARLAFRLEALPEPQRDAAQGEIAAMRRLIEDSLALDRSGSMPLERFDLAELVEAMVEECRALAQPVNLTTANHATVAGSRLGMRRLIQNLIDNALRYGVAAELSFSGEDGVAELIVRDHGPGFSAEMLARGCEPFVRGDASRNSETGGSGLGLAIAAAITAQHRGRLILGNRPAGGGEVRLVLPLV